MLQLNLRKLSFFNRLILKNILHLLNMHKQRHVRIKAPFHQQVIMCALKISKLQVILNESHTLKQYLRSSIQL